MCDIENFPFKRFLTLAKKGEVYTYNSYVLSTVVAQIKQYIVGHVIDIGCGASSYVLSLSGEKSDSLITGLDLSFKNLVKNQIAHMKIVGDANLMPFRKETSDCMMMVDVVEHLQNPGQCLREITRCLKAGRKLIIFTPNLYGASGTSTLGKLIPLSLRGRILKLIRWPLSASPYPLYYRLNTIKSLKKIANETGLTVEKIFYMCSIPRWFYRWYTLALSYFSMIKLIVGIFKLRFLAEQFCIVLSKDRDVSTPGAGA